MRKRPRRVRCGPAQEPHRWAISLHVGLRDLQRRLPRFLIRAQTEMEQPRASRGWWWRGRGPEGSVKVLGTSWWRGPETGELLPNATLGNAGEGHGGARSTPPSCELETPSRPAQLFWKQRARRPINRPCRPVSRCGPKGSRWLGLGLSLPDREADPCLPPHPDASNLIWHWHCHLGPDGGDSLNASTSTPTFLRSAHATAGVNVAHPPSRL